MNYKVIFKIEKYELLEKLYTKIENLRNYMKEQNHELEIEIVMNGDVVKVFDEDYSKLIDPQLDVAVCHNALHNHEMDDINYQNIRTVPAGIGEYIEKKADDWVDYTIE